VKADQSELKPFASLDWASDRWPFDNEKTILYTGQVLEFLEFRDKSRFVLVRDFRTKFEQN
jgi:hypothetical protein